jgi:hypothetical protein
MMDASITETIVIRKWVNNTKILKYVIGKVHTKLQIGNSHNFR